MWIQRGKKEGGERGRRWDGWNIGEGKEREETRKGGWGGEGKAIDDVLCFWCWVSCKRISSTEKKERRGGGGGERGELEGREGEEKGK